MKILYTSILISLSVLTSHSQTNCDTLIFGTSGIHDWAGQCVKTNDNKIVVVGTLNNAGNFSGGDIYLRKYDSNLNQIWSQAFYSGGGTDVASGVIATSDGGYLVHSSFGDSNPAGMYSAGYIIKTDSSGNQEWVQTLIGQSYGDNYGSVTVENSNGEFICYGQVQHHTGCGGYSTRITKLTPLGSILWSNCVSINPDWSGGIDKLSSSDNYISVYNDATTGKMEIRKWDDNGNQTGLTTYQYDSQFGSSGKVRRCNTGGFFLFGQYDSTGGQKNAFISKLDDNMISLWEKSFKYSSENKFNEIIEDSSSQIYCTGNIKPTAIEQNVVVAKLNSFGNILDTIIFGHLIFGSMNSTVNSLGICVNSSGDVFCTGSVNDNGYDDAFIFKVCLNTTGISEFINDNAFIIYPNPINDFVTVKVKNASLNKNYSVIDQLGRTVLSGKISSETTTINFNDLASGIYHFKLASGNQQSVNIIKR